MWNCLTSFSTWQCNNHLHISSRWETKQRSFTLVLRSLYSMTNSNLHCTFTVKLTTSVLTFSSSPLVFTLTLCCLLSLAQPHTQYVHKKELCHSKNNRYRKGWCSWYVCTLTTGFVDWHFFEGKRASRIKLRCFMHAMAIWILNFYAETSPKEFLQTCVCDIVWYRLFTKVNFATDLIIRITSLHWHV